MIRTADTDDLGFIRDLQRRFARAIGYIPPAATAREVEWGHVFHANLNDDDAGFLLMQPALSGQRTTAAIIQAAVRMDAQRQHVGLALVEHVVAKAKRAGSTIVQAVCREDLEAVHFWEAAGFRAVAMKPGGLSEGKNVIIFRRAIYVGADLSGLYVPAIRRGPAGKFCKAEDEPRVTLVGGGPLCGLGTGLKR